MSKNIVLAINFEYTLMEFYKKLSLSENDVMVIFMIKHLLEQNNTLITADLLSIKMNVPTKEIDNILVNLLRKKYIAYVESNKGLLTSLEPLESRLSDLYQQELNKDRLTSFNEKTAQALKNIYEIFEKELGRSLSPVEFSLIDDWVHAGFSESECIDALHEALSKKKTTLKAVDHILLKWRARDDLEKAGHTAVNDNWKEGVEKTMDIAQKKWGDKHEDK